MNTHDHHDDDSLPGEDELKALYGSLPSREPSPSLDRAVHRMAAQAVRPIMRRSRWPAMAASIAIMALAGGISWRLYGPSPEHAAIPAQKAKTDSAPAAAPTTASEPQAVAAPSLVAPATPMTPRPHETFRSALKPRVLATAPAMPPATRQTAAAEQQDQAMASSAPLPAPPAPAAVAAQGYAAPSAASAEEARTGNAARHSLAAKAMPMQTPTTAASVDPTAPNPADTPEQELGKIRQLFAQQRRDEALLRLAAFRKAHPDMPVPDDLQNQQAHHE